MSLKNDKYAQLLNDKQPIDGKRLFHFMLVLMFFIQLILPIGIHAQGEPDDGEVSKPEVSEVQAAEEESVTNVESPMSLGSQSEEEEPEEDGSQSQESEEAPVEETSEDPPEEIVEEPVPEPDKPPVPEGPKEEVKEEPTEPKEPEVVEDKEDIEEVLTEEDEREKYDPGAMLDGFPARPFEGIPNPLIQFAPGSLGSALTLLQGSRMKQTQTTNNHDLAPGEVKTSKTATPVPGMVNTWDVTVRVEGRDDNKVETTDVVLVIDRSGSMDDRDNGWNNPTRLGYAQTAANNFIDTMIPADPNLRIGIVSFAQNASINRQFTRTISNLRSSVNSLNASGGTHTQSGIVQGRALLNGSSADNKFVVLLSDGQPTYSYRPNNWSYVNSEDRAGIYDGQYNSNAVVGNGSELTEWFWWNGYWRYVDNGSAAIRAGQDSRTGINAIFTIAVNAGAEGTPILQQIANPGLAYSTSNPDELQEIYDMIGTQISTQYALKFPTVTDEMGDGFTLIQNTLNKTEGITSVAPATGSSNQTINWDISPTVTNLVPGTTDIRYAEMTYRVEINDDILDISGAKTDDHKLFKTNKSTKLNYLDAHDVEQNEDIESPEVDPVLLKIRKNLLNVSPNESRQFNVQIKRRTTGFNHTESLVPNNEYVWLTTLRQEGTYDVTETGVTGTPVSTLSDFIISYQIDGENKTNFAINHPGGNPRGDVTIDVTNQQLPDDTVPDNPLIRLSKTFSGLTQAQIDSLTNFKLTVTSQSDPSKTTDLTLADAISVTESNGEITYDWELENWPAGTYTVTEHGEELVNYTVDTTYNPATPGGNTGEVTTIAPTVIVDNDDIGRWTSVKSAGVYNLEDEYGQIPNLIVVKLTQGEGSFIWSDIQFSELQREAIINYLNAKAPYLSMNNGENYWFSDDSFNFRGEFKYDINTGNLTIPAANQWAQIAFLKYDFDGGYPADISVNNTYHPKTVGFEFDKVDELGEPLTEAEFTLEKLEDDGSFTLIDNIGTDPIFKYEDLSEGTYTLTEVAAPDGYYLPEDNTWTFDVVWNDDTKQLEIVFAQGDEIEDGQIANYPKGRLPDTGGPGIAQSIIIGMFSLMMLGTVYVWQLKRDEVFPNE